MGMMAVAPTSQPEVAVAATSGLDFWMFGFLLTGVIATDPGPIDPSLPFLPEVVVGELRMPPVAPRRRRRRMQDCRVAKVRDSYDR